MRKTPVERSVLQKACPEVFLPRPWWQQGLKPNHPKTRIVFDAIETAKKFAKNQLNKEKTH